AQRSSTERTPLRPTGSCGRLFSGGSSYHHRHSGLLCLCLAMRLLIYLGKVVLLAAALPLLAGAAKTTGTSTSATSRPVRAPRRR
ncbi:unnamed protein product, partial [Scytosiphon promiscuus]